MNRESSKNARARGVLAVLIVGVLGLAASPAALAKDRGGPGQPGAQMTLSQGFTLLPAKFDPVSWSD